MLSTLRVSEVYRIWQKRVTQLSPDECKSRMKNMLLLIVGMYKAESVHLSKIARKLPIRAKKLSLTRRLRRFLDNGSVNVRQWYRPVVEELIRAAATGGQIHLLIDSSKVGFGHQLLMVGIAYRRRALPLAWTWVSSASGHSTTCKQVKLLDYVQKLLPEGVKVSLAGDAEFKNTLLIEHLHF